MKRHDLGVVQPTPLLADVGDTRATFERLWGMLPTHRPRRMWRFLPHLGLFLKGQVAPPGRSRNAWRHGRRMLGERRALLRLAWHGVPVAPVVAWGEERELGFVRRAFLLQRLVSGAVDLDTFLRQVERGERPDRRREALAAVGRLVGSLHDKGAFHRDLSPRNVLVRPRNGTLEAVLIDCPRAAIGPPPVVRAGLRRADLYRLTRGVLERGAGAGEARVLLEAAGAGEIDRIVTYARRALELGTTRPHRVRLWYVTGW